jgi:hypothetical protein
MVRVPEASNRSSRVTDVINDAANIGAQYFNLTVQGQYLAISTDIWNTLALNP